jgi:tetratricopeptide (TPR) repeat protein
MEQLWGIIDGIFRGAETFLTSGWDLTKGLQATAALVTISSGAYAILQAVRFAERHLSKRLLDFLKREEKRLAAGCHKILTAQERPTPLRPQLEPIYTNRALNRALIKLRLGKRDQALSALEEALTLIDQKVHTADQLRSAHERQRGAAHLMLGSIADSKGQHAQALEHFEAALRINPDDLDALKYVGLQFLKSANPKQALTCFEKLETKAREKSDELLAAQSVVLQAHANYALPAPRLGRANALLRRVTFNFPGTMPLLERAGVHEFHGLVRRELGRPIALQSYKQAQKTFEVLMSHRGNVTEARQGFARVSAIINEITQASAGEIPNAEAPSAPLSN